MLVHHLTALVGQSVFLLAAARLVGDGHFNQTDIQSGEQIGLAKMLIVFQPERLFDLLPGHLAGKDREQSDFRGDFRATSGVEVVTVSKIIRSMKAMKGAESVWPVLSRRAW